MLGINEKKLKFISKEEYLKLHPEFSHFSEDVITKQYDIMESSRKKKLQKAQKLREELIKIETDEKGTKSNFLTNNIFNYNSNKISPNTTLSKMFSGTKSLNLKEKNSNNENELLLLKKQNLSEIKNLIDFTVKKNNEIKLNEIKQNLIKQKEEKMQKLKQSQKEKKEKEERQKEYENEEKKKNESKKAAKEYRELIQKNMENNIKMDELNKKKQKEKFLKQIEYEKHELEFRNKIDDYYKKQHSLRENKLLENNKKNILRLFKLEKRRKEFEDKLKIDSQKRDEKIINFKKKNYLLLCEKEKKFEDKQKAIENYKNEQKKQKIKILEQKKEENEEKEKKINLIKKQNEEKLEIKKQNILKHLKKINENIINQKEENNKLLEIKILENKLKEEKQNELYEEYENQIFYKNYLKMKKLEDKDNKIKQKKKELNNLINQKIKLKNEMREKKNKMLKQINEILNKGKLVDSNEIYKKVFSFEDFNLLKLRKSQSNVNIIGNEKTLSNFFMTMNKRKYNSNNISQDDAPKSDNI